MTVIEDWELGYYCEPEASNFAKSGYMCTDVLFRMLAIFAGC